MSKMNIPASLVTTANPNAAPDSPVLWDGADVIVSKESLCNIVRIRSDLDALVSKQSGYSSDLKAVEQLQNEADAKIQQADAQNKVLKKLTSSITRDVYGIEGRVENIANEFEKVEQANRETAPALEEIERVRKAIMDGSIIATDQSSEDLELIRSKLSEFLLIDDQINVVDLAPGENVNLKFNITNSTYAVNLVYPKTADVVRSGNMIKVETIAGKTRFSFKDKIIQAVGGIELRPASSGYLYNLGVSAKFLQGDLLSGVEIKRVGAHFTANLAQSVRENANATVSFSDGLFKENGIVNVNTKVLPFFEEGTNATVITTDSKTSVGFNTTASERDDSNIAYFGENPVKVETTLTGKAVSAVAISIPDDYFEKSAGTEILNATEKYAEDIDYRLSKQVEWGDVNFSARRALACPILNLYDLIIGSSEKAIYNSPPDALALYKAFGAGKHRIDLDIDLLPYMSLADSVGGLTKISFKQEIDLYLVVERYLAKMLGREGYKISPSDYGTKVRIISVGNDLTAAHENTKIAEPSYNSSIRVESFTEPSHISAMPCGITVPTTLTGVNGPLTVTGGDIDFFAGYARFGQKNNARLTIADSMPNLKLVSSTVETVEEGIRQTIEILDNASSSSFTMVCLKRRAYDLDSNVDYIEEISGTENPGEVRAFARLYCNWKYNDEELNKLVFLLGQKECCFADYVSSAFLDVLFGSPNPSGEFSHSYLRDQITPEPITVTLDKARISEGKLAFTIIANAEAGVMVANANELLKYFNIPVGFIVDANYGMVFDSTTLSSSCCIA